jgi:hypothetical protein
VAASVASPMRRTLLLGLFTALLLAPAAYADSTTTKILRDCNDDGVLEGHYTPSEMRKARDSIPTDLQEYSDCADVLSRALASLTSSAGAPGGSAGGAAPAATPAQQFSDTAVGGRVAAPTTPADHQALADAAAGGGQPVVVDGRAVAPAADFSSHVGRNSLPSTLIVVLVLLAGAVLAIVVPTVRRRVLARKAP